jgi:predicted metal-dependent phosphoesterase TrpH
MIIDLHCHTLDRSDDSVLTLPAIGRLALDRGVEAVCITDHDAFWKPDALEQAGKDAGVLFIPGAEINTDAGHVLVFGLSQYRFGYHHPDRLIEAVARAGGAAILAHPYRRTLPPGIGPGFPAFAAALERARSNPLLAMVDAIEVLNARGEDDQNAFSTSLAEALGMPETGASDAHAEADFGAAATAFERPVRGVEDLIRELKTGRFRPASLR